MYNMTVRLGWEADVDIVELSMPHNVDVIFNGDLRRV